MSKNTSNNPATGLTIWLLAPILILLVALMIGLLVSFTAGFDVTDEGWYLYSYSTERYSNSLFIDPIAGILGTLFYNNILVWRYIGFGLLLLSATTFATGLHRLGEALDIAPRKNVSRLALLAAVLAGALAFYSYGPPTFSYRLISSAGILGAFGGLMFAVLARRSISKHGWLLIASLWAVLMVAGRISVAVTYPLAALPLLWLSARLIGWSRTAGLAALHCLYGLLWTVFFAFGLGFYDRFARIAMNLYVSGQIGSHKARDILPQHARDLVEFAISSSRLAGAAVLLAVAASALFQFVQPAARRYPIGPWFQNLAQWLALISALMPLWIAYNYIERWPKFVLQAALDCRSIDMLVCQGPTPALTGTIFMHVGGAQLLCLLMVVALDRLLAANLNEHSSSKTLPTGTLAAWLLMLGFLLAVTPASSFYTNVGLFYHTILSIGPLFAAIYFGLALIPLRTIRIPSSLVPLSLVVMVAVVSMIDVHNRALFSYRVEGDIRAQTTKLNEPRELRGLWVNPKLEAVFRMTREAIARGGFDHRRDVVVAAYSIPGVVLAAGGRTLGQSWLNTGYEGIDDANCHLINRDPTDIHALGRVFLFRNMPLTSGIKDCLRTRGFDFDRETVLAAFSLDELRKIVISVVPIKTESR